MESGPWLFVLCCHLFTCQPIKQTVDQTASITLVIMALTSFLSTASLPLMKVLASEMDCLLTRSHALLCPDIRFCFSCHVTAAERSLCSVSILHLGYET